MLLECRLFKSRETIQTIEAVGEQKPPPKSLVLFHIDCRYYIAVI